MVEMSVHEFEEETRDFVYSEIRGDGVDFEDFGLRSW